MYVLNEYLAHYTIYLHRKTNDQGLVKLLKVGPRWSEPSDIGCTKL